MKLLNIIPTKSTEFEMYYYYNLYCQQKSTDLKCIIITTYIVNRNLLTLNVHVINTIVP